VFVDGFITQFIAKEKVPNGKVIGVDIDHGMVQFAQENYGCSNLEFIQCDACHIKYMNQFNLVVSFACLSWIPIELHKLVFLNIWNGLVPEGNVFIRLAEEGDRPLYTVINKVCNKEQWIGIFNDYKPTWALQNKERLYEVLKHIGFNKINITSVPKAIDFKSLDLFSQWLSTWIPHRLLLQQKESAEFLSQVSTEYCIMMGISNGQTIPITMPGLLVQAQK